MNKKKILDFLKTLLIVAFATLLFAVAVCGYIYAGLGSDSVSVFQQGLSEAIGCELGIAALIYGVSFLILDFFISRKNIGWATIINSFLLGPCIKLVQWLMEPVFTVTDHLAYRVALLSMGILLVSVSCVILIRTNKGKNVLDAVAWGLSEKLKLPYRIARIIVDALMMLTGWLLGGVVGLGSIAAVFLTGPIIQFLNKTAEKIKAKRQEK